MHVTARGFDQAEAKAAADAHKLKVEQVGDALVGDARQSAAHADCPGTAASSQMVDRAEGAPAPALSAIEPHAGRLMISELAGAEVMGSRGETRVTGSHRAASPSTHSGGALEIDDVPSLKLNAAKQPRHRSSASTGPIAVEAIGGELDSADIVGPLEVEARNTELAHRRRQGAQAAAPHQRHRRRDPRRRACAPRRASTAATSRSTSRWRAPAPVTIYNPAKTSA